MAGRIPAAIMILAALAAPAAAATERAVFAGGCFWSVEAHFESMKGVVAAVSGFSGGQTRDPTYQSVIAGGTGHLEAVEVTYDPAIVSYEALVDAFWHFIDPTDPAGQFCDKGEQYHTAIFYRDAAQKAVAERTSRQVATKLQAPVATRLVASLPFYPAETYHQDFAARNPVRYEAYRVGCGRDNALRAVWGAQAFAGLPK